MDNNSIYFDGSKQPILNATIDQPSNEPFQITDETRKNIGMNPYFPIVEN